MKITDVKNQFTVLIYKGLRVYINTTPIVKSHPQFPNIKIESIDTSSIELEDDDIDVLLDGNELKIKSFNTTGIYWATDKDKNVSTKLSLKLYVNSLIIQVVNDKLEIIECKCIAISNN
jgi:hypothetical protein